jgi:hypothetical protein
MQDNDKTVIMPSIDMQSLLHEKVSVPSVNSLQITLLNSASQSEEFFSQGFSIGRSKDNDFVIIDNMVSRHHLKVNIEYGEWYIQDLGSTNGIFIDEHRISGNYKLVLPSVICLGKSGPLIQLQLPDSTPIQKQADTSDDVTQFIQSQDVSASTPAIEMLDTEDIKQRFFTGNKDNAGEYTQMVRRVIHDDKKKNTKKYRWGVSVVFLLLCFAIGMIVFQQINYKAAALNMYYQTKALEVDISLLEIKLRGEASSSLQDSIVQTREKLHKTQDEYKSIIDNLNALTFPVRLTRIIRHKIGLGGSSPSQYERELIQMVAEKFGESQLELSESFIAEVHRYINKWKRSSRLHNAMTRLDENNYAPIILAAMKKQGLPAQFLYLCLQESNFNSKAVGPETRYGIAKGAWQFLPGTGQDFGLSTGSMTDEISYDFTDERFNFPKATHAAAKYLKHIYSTEAQASGLLVMAGYNYGHNRVRRMIRQMPDNPKDKNFWRFVSQYQIPDETYQYVLYIFSAAVIGENPEHFGFKFKSPTI